MSSRMPPERRWRDLVENTDDDQPAGVGMDDVVDALAQGPAGSDHVQGSQKPGILTFRKLMKRIP